jgi:O-antigen ligase
MRNILVIATATLFVLFIIFVSAGKINSPYEGRQIIWKLGLEAVIKRPILGFGAESGEAIYNLAFKNLNASLSGLIIDRAHNLFLDVTMWSGVVGLVVFCGFLFIRFKSLKENGRRLTFLSFLLYSMFQPLSVVHWLLLFVL